jgi:hypothetical protein
VRVVVEGIPEKEPVIVESEMTPAEIEVIVEAKLLLRTSCFESRARSAADASPSALRPKSISKEVVIYFSRC